MIELVMISENPFFYNKQKRLEIVKIRLEEALLKYNYKKQLFTSCVNPKSQFVNKKLIHSKNRIHHIRFFEVFRMFVNPI